MLAKAIWPIYFQGMSSKSESFGAFLGCLFQILLMGIVAFGIYRGFNHTVSRGILAIVFPPYAAFKGIAVLWEQAEWEKDWEFQTNNLAVVLLNTAGGELEDVEKKMAVGMSRSQLREYVSDLPDKKRIELQAASEALCEANWNVQRNVMIQMLTGRDRAPETGLSAYVEKFESVDSFIYQWTGLKSDLTAMKDGFRKLLEKENMLPPDIDPSTGLPDGRGVDERKIYNDPVYRSKIQSSWEESIVLEERNRERADRFLKDIFGPDAGVNLKVTSDIDLFTE